MIAFKTTVVHGLLICIPFTVFAVSTFWARPRLWLHSLPKDIAETAGPKTPTEVKQTAWLKVAILIILPGLSTISLVYAGLKASDGLTVLGAFAHLYGVWLIVHLWDLLVIDLAHVVFIDSDHPPIPNTEGAAGYKDIGFHTRTFVKACIFSLLFVVPVALIVSWLI